MKNNIVKILMVPALLMMWTQPAPALTLSYLSYASSRGNSGTTKPDEPGNKVPFLCSSISLTGGLSWGTIGEYVMNGDFVRSRLDWELNPVISAGAGITTFIAGRYVVDFSFSTSLNEKSGHMEDFDWDYSGIRTNYSKHTNKLDYARTINAAAGYVFAWSNSIVLAPCVGFKNMKYKMTGIDGYYDYLIDGKGNFYGPVIVYQQNYLVPYIGLTAGISVTDKLYCELSCEISFFADCFDLDNHLLRKTDFYDSMFYGFYFNGRASVHYRLVPTAELTLSYVCTVVPTLHGDTYTINNGNGARSAMNQNAAAVSLLSMGMEFSVLTHVTWIQ